MKKNFKKAIAVLSSAAMLASMANIPVMADNEAEESAIANDAVLAEDSDVNVIKTWKFDFGSKDDVADGYTYVAPDVNYTLNTSGSEQYGFIGTNEEDYNLGNRLDGFGSQKGQKITLTEGGGTGLLDGIGSTGEDTYGNAGDRYYPVRFALKVEDEKYFRVKATVTTLDNTKPATASLYTERKHPIYTDKEIQPGESVTKEFTIRTTPIYYEKSEPKGQIADGMVNVSVLGENTALASLEIEQIEDAPTLWVLGDSTVTDGNCVLPFSPLQNYTGVGTGLTKYLPSNIAMVNEGEGGLSAADNYHFNMVKNRIKKGDYLYLEYGHNHKSDGPAGYLKCLDKYYQVCKSVGATLIIVGPIDRHNDYNSETNEWTTSLAKFSRAGKGYVDTMMYGGEDNANEYVSKYNSDGETAALEYANGVVDVSGGIRAVENIAFVDLNQPSLDWFSTITASGSIGGQEVTNNSKLIDYYFQTGKNGSTDKTHPNDTGAENLAYLFYTTADTDAYPAIKPLMANFEEGAEHEVPTKVRQDVMDAGNKAGQGNVGWPTYYVPTDEEYPVKIKNVKFNDDGTVASVKVQVVNAKQSMDAYGIIVITIKDAEGNEIGKVQAKDQVDNSTGTGNQEIKNFTTDVKLPEGGSYTAMVWQALDSDEGLKIDPANVAYSYEYVPADIQEYLLPGSDSDVETFNYYGKDSLSGAGSWTYGGSAGSNLALGKEDDGTTYATIAVSNPGNSYFVMRPLENLVDDNNANVGTGSSGKYMVQADIKYKSGANAAFKLAKTTTNASPFVSDSMELFTINNSGKLTINGTDAGQLSPEQWTNVKYVIDMDNGTASISVGGAEAKVIELPAYASNEVPKIDTYKNFVIEGGKTASFEFLLSNLTVAQLRQDKLPDRTIKVQAEAANAETASLEFAAEENGGASLNDEAKNIASYENGKLIINADKAYDDAKVYVAEYNENGSLKAVKSTDVRLAAGENKLDINANIGDTVIVWTSENEPIANKLVVETPEPTAPATEEPTFTPEPTAPATEEPTFTPEPTVPATEEPTFTPEPTAPATEEPTFTPEPTAPAEANGTVSIEGVEGTEYTAQMNTIVTINAEPNEGYEFNGWKNAAGETVSYLPSLKVRMHNDETYTASFKKAAYDPINYSYKEEFSLLTTETLASNGWKSTNAQGSLTIKSDDSHGNYLNFAPGSQNSRGANMVYSEAISGDYIVEFDTALTAGNNQSTSLSILNNAVSAINNDQDSYIFRLFTTNSTTWTVNNEEATVEIPKGTWVHVKLKVNTADSKVEAEITNGDTVLYNGTVSTVGGNEFKGIHMRAGRYNADMSLDNIKVYTADQEIN